VPTVEEMKDAVERYAAAHSAGDVDAVVALFAPDAVVADPVDQPAHEGREAVRAFFAGTHAMIDGMDLAITGPIRAVDRFAAVPLRAVSSVGGQRYAVDIVDVFTFGDDGLVTEMRAYWNSSEITPVEG
jgi:steroid delta-isomerase